MRVRRTKRRPPQRHKCDMSIGVDYSAKTPRIRSCHNFATVEFNGMPGCVGEVWVCEEHAVHLESKHSDEHDPAAQGRPGETPTTDTKD